jgi:hypothetical protein
MAHDSNSAPQALRTYTNDMSALDKHIVEPLQHQKDDDRFKTDPRVASFLGDALQTFERHVNELQPHVERFGGGAGKVVKEAVAGALGVAAGVYDKVRKDPVSRALRDDYVALNQAAISCTMLHTTALAFSDEPLAELSKNQLNELTPLIMRLTEIIPHVVIQELQDEDASVRHEAADLASKAGQEAWSK